MANAYASINEIRDSGGVPLAADNESSHDERIMAVVESVSREIDKWCRRYFYPRKASLIMRASDALYMWMPEDLIEVEHLDEDTDWNGTYEQRWDAIDYVLWPYNANPQGELHRARPYRRIDVQIRGGSGRRVFIAGLRRYQVTGTWGYLEVAEPVEGVVGYTESPTTAVLRLVGQHSISMGNTIAMGSELLYVRGVRNPVTSRMIPDMETEQQAATAISDIRSHFANSIRYSGNRDYQPFEVFPTTGVFFQPSPRTIVVANGGDTVQLGNIGAGWRVTITGSGFTTPGNVYTINGVADGRHFTTPTREFTVSEAFPDLAGVANDEALTLVFAPPVGDSVSLTRNYQTTIPVFPTTGVFFQPSPRTIVVANGGDTVQLGNIGAGWRVTITGTGINSTFTVTEVSNGISGTTPTREFTVSEAFPDLAGVANDEALTLVFAPPVAANAVLTEITVSRGVNGYPKVRQNAEAVSVIEYPPAIREATIMQASRIHARRVSGFSADIGFDQTGRHVPNIGFDRDVYDLLAPYREHVI